ncbi:uncharacterized protein TNCV_1368841 [Trichonephila clavipes]|nr:uncharacterized protein TNCV_1368841 [Trichonephila clavipes]
MITNFFIPELNNHDVQEMWFQQDGATCHTARATIDLLKNTLGDRLISRFGPVNWPPRSWAAVAEWYRYRTVACLVTSSSPVPLKTRRVGQRCTLNLSRAETSSRWCGVVVRRGGCQQCDVNNKINQSTNLGGCSSLMVKVTNSSHEFEPCTTKLMHIKYVEAQTSSKWSRLEVRRAVPAQVSTSSLEHGPSPNSLE